MTRPLTVAIALLLSAPFQAMAQDRFLSRITLPTGQTAVIAEGDFEASSIGSFSVRLYAPASPANATTFFIAGLIRPRDGVVEKATLADIDGDEQPEIIVIARSVGTGSYLSAHAFGFTGDDLLFRGTVKELAPDADPIAALRKTLSKPEEDPGAKQDN